MGYAKRLLMEEQARLYRTSEDAVCPRCFHNHGIVAFIKANLECNECSVCGRVSKRAIAARADRVLEFFLDRVHRHYQNADGNAPYDKEDGHWYVTIWTMHEIVFDELYDIAEFETLEWLYEHLKDDIVYCEQDWQILSPGQALTAGWERFSEALKHETRFLFFSPKKNEDDSGEPYRVLPSEMLKELGEVIIQCGLVRKVKKGTRVFRVRGHKPRKPLTTPKDLGPPPKEYATSAGRMNAPGIVVMYTAYEAQTAIAEVTGRLQCTITPATGAERRLMEKLCPLPSFLNRSPASSIPSDSFFTVSSSHERIVKAKSSVSGSGFASICFRIPSMVSPANLVSMPSGVRFPGIPSRRTVIAASRSHEMSSVRWTKSYWSSSHRLCLR